MGGGSGTARGEESGRSNQWEKESALRAHAGLNRDVLNSRETEGGPFQAMEETENAASRKKKERGLAVKIHRTVRDCPREDQGRSTRKVLKVYDWGGRGRREPPIDLKL